MFGSVNALQSQRVLTRIRQSEILRGNCPLGLFAVVMLARTEYKLPVRELAHICISLDIDFIMVSLCSCMSKSCHEQISCSLC